MDTIEDIRGSAGTLERRVVDRLIEKKYHISFAESCTAGMAAARLVNVPDASKVLDVRHWEMSYVLQGNG